MEALGRLVNIVGIADGRWIPLKDASGITFLGVLDGGDTWTLQEARDGAGTGAQNLASIDHYYTANGVGGAWTRRTQAAAAAVTTPNEAAQDSVVIEVEDTSLSDGFTHVRLSSTSTGTVTALLRDLQVQRAPQNLAALA
jgi:hypothetical protein